ncbi:MAG: DUF4126 domain-containing protein [Phenylobacterium sp.]|uniref:DUF4126 domain-containing protein n=1 Tax=Phenylobacterium sp. TaxID=1871053 RepID=UPI00391CE9B1
MTIYLAALLIGVIAGLRTMTAPAAVSASAALGWMSLAGTPLAFLGLKITAYVLVVLALVELVADQLRRTPSRKSALPFGARIASGALSGAALGATGGALAGGAIAGAAGAVVGTLGGYEARTRLTAAAGGRDRPIALLEDVVAIGGAILLVAPLS